MVSPALQITPSSTTGSIPLQGRTVSICPHNATAPAALPAPESDQVARVGTGPFRGIIEADGKPQPFQLGLAPFRHNGLTARRAFDARKFAEQIEQAVGLHRLPFQSGRR